MSCPVCANETSEEWLVKFGACDPCAERIANEYSYHRTGRWLTRPNAPVPPRKKAFIGQALRTQVFERDAYRCVRCESFHDLTADHVHPESLGGETTLDNLQTLCRSCNSKKGIGK